MLLDNEAANGRLAIGGSDIKESIIKLRIERCDIDNYNNPAQENVPV